MEEARWERQWMNCKNTYNHPLSRVRVRAHLQEFYCFCCHKCHRLLHKSLNNNTLQLYLEQLLTLQRYTPSKYAHRDSKKRTFYPTILLFFLHFCCLIPHFLPSAVTLVTAKNQNRCRMRALHVRTRNTHRIALAFFLSRWEQDEANTHLHQILTPPHRNIILTDRKTAVFCDLFPLWGFISPYTYRGTPISVWLSSFSLTAKAI